jgi:hypothetical protein
MVTITLFIIHHFASGQLKTKIQQTKAWLPHAIRIASALNQSPIQSLQLHRFVGKQMRE